MEDARRAEGSTVRWKRNGDARVAPKWVTRYFLSQPRLPLIQATLVRGASGVSPPTRPASQAFLFFLAFFLEPFFLCFLPFLIFGRTLRTFSISSGLHSRTRTPPSFRTLGAGTFLANTYL